MNKANLLTAVPRLLLYIKGSVTDFTMGANLCYKVGASIIYIPFISVEVHLLVTLLPEILGQPVRDGAKSPILNR